MPFLSLNQQSKYWRPFKSPTLIWIMLAIYWQRKRWQTTRTFTHQQLGLLIHLLLQRLSVELAECSRIHRQHVRLDLTETHWKLQLGTTQHCNSALLHFGLLLVLLSTSPVFWTHCTLAAPEGELWGLLEHVLQGRCPFSRLTSSITEEIHPLVYKQSVH